MPKTTHGLSKTPEYRSWKDMKSRCFNPSTKYYSDYGGRGISVCDRWLNFENFFADMELKPTPKHSIDRIDNDGDYSPKNCKWSTCVEQSNNQRTNHLITIGCVALTIARWTKEMGFPRNLISKRLKMGWSKRDAVMTPINTAYQRNR